MCTNATADDSDLRQRNDAIIVRAIERIDGFDVSDNPQVQQAIQRYIASQVGTAKYVELAAKFRPEQMQENLVKIVQSHADDSVRVKAAKLLLSESTGRASVLRILESESSDEIAKVAKPLALLGTAKARSMLTDVVSDPSRPFDQRKCVLMAMALNRASSKRLLTMARREELPADSRLLVGGLLSQSTDQDVRKAATELFPQPSQKDRKPLPPIDQLARMKGDAARGAKLFSSVATCAKCHPVGGNGKSVGPDLTEIGSKLSREAMLVSILDPNAAISHSFESYAVLTVDGQVITGLMISKNRRQAGDANGRCYRSRDPGRSG